MRHFSEKPYPNTIDPSLFRNKEDLTDYLGGLYDKVPEPWQARLPWAPYTVVEGQRFRTNIKVIYNMNKLFHNQSGAFSGNPRAISTEEVYNKFISDDEEDLKELINDLKYGRKIIIPKTQTYLKVSNLSTQQGQPSKFIAELNLSLSQTAANIATDIDDNISKAFNIYPNPCNENVNIYLPHLNTPTIKGSIYNISGQLVFDDYFLMNSSRQISINTTKFSDGIYIVHLRSTDYNWNCKEKIIIKH